MRSPSLVVVRYLVELYRNGDITAQELHEAIPVTIANSPKEPPKKWSSKSAKKKSAKESSSRQT
jgi:hypothetical protein